MIKKLHTRSGLTIIEIVLSFALALIFVTALNPLIYLGIRGSEVAKNRATAARLASEGMEAMYNIRRSWTTASQFSASWAGITGANEYYQPAVAGGVWSLGSEFSNPPTVPSLLQAPYGKFTRTIKIEKMSRLYYLTSYTGEVVLPGTANSADDPNTRLVTVTVSWSDKGNLQTYKLMGLITNTGV